MEKLKSGAEKLGLSLTDGQLEKFDTYYRELLEWNWWINLTSITEYNDVQLNHFLDSLTVALAIDTDKSNYLRVIDVGTGAGLPGIPLKIVSPEIDLTLLEATAKKAGFLHHIIDKLVLENVKIITGRAEDIAHRQEYRERFDIAVSRAVAPLAALVELTLPFCRTGGSFIAQKKGFIQSEVDRAEKAIGMLGGKLREVRRIDLDEFPDGFQREFSLLGYLLALGTVENPEVDVLRQNPDLFFLLGVIGLGPKHLPGNAIVGIPAQHRLPELGVRPDHGRYAVLQLFEVTVDDVAHGYLIPLPQVLVRGRPPQSTIPAF